MKQWPAMSADTCCFHEAAQLRAGPLPYSAGPNLRCGFPRESEVSGTEQSLPEQERNPQKGVGEVKAESPAPFTALPGVVSGPRVRTAMFSGPEGVDASGAEH